MDNVTKFHFGSQQIPILNNLLFSNQREQITTKFSHNCLLYKYRALERAILPSSAKNSVPVKEKERGRKMGHFLCSCQDARSKLLGTSRLGAS